ncbi:histidine protein methyltransferase 1 homolog isoform X2 [Dysidea avara]|uniref:histidine protein methyltransferase 1 homolog isoform X2 n=1 Tax=Dysidea avara TaxID=196820 RepID=UPI00331F6C3E
MATTTQFRFNFQLDNDAETARDIEPEQQHTNNAAALPAREIFIEPFHHQLAERHKYTTTNCASVQLQCALLDNIGQQVKELRTLTQQRDTLESCSTLLEAASKNCDLVPGVYEGGLKIWEELGCGAGLPGIFAALHGAEHATFQDYNPGVIHLITIPNILSNIPATQSPVTTFFAGDWSELVGVMNPSDDISLKYDLIVTSETIYCVESQPKLLEMMKKHVKPVTGRVLVAGKCHYFGVGGSMDMFKKLIKDDGYFKCSSCKLVTDCSVPREVIMLEQC